MGNLNMLKIEFAFDVRLSRPISRDKDTPATLQTWGESYMPLGFQGKRRLQNRFLAFAIFRLLFCNLFVGALSLNTVQHALQIEDCAEFGGVLE